MNTVSQKASAGTDPITEGTRAAAVGDLEKALRIFIRALSTDTENPRLHNELGVVYYRKGDYRNAAQSFRRATELNPAFARAWTNLGACYNEEKDNPSAVRCHQRALELNPRLADAWGNLAKAWTESEEFEMAVYCYRKALELQPSRDLKRGLAKAYRKGGRFARAEALLREVLREDPQDADAHFGLSLALFHQQLYKEATKEFEWRMNTRDMVQHRKDLHPIFNAPAYRGGDLSDKTLLLHTEQGFGDNIQFARFIRLVRPAVKRLVMWTRPGLGRLFKDNFPIDAVSENVFKLPKFDCQLPLLSVPSIFDPGLDSLESFTPYLSVSAETGGSIALHGHLEVGLVWGASDSGFDHANKKVPLKLLEPVLKTHGINWHSLQVGSDRQDLLASDLYHNIADRGKQLGNFLDTANLIHQLDLVISCDTAVAHLAGAMGKPVWVMLKKEPDWRWGSDADTTPWYPSARLFRQQSHGDWTMVIRRIRSELARCKAGGRIR